jgi:general secretion pathway protein F
MAVFTYKALNGKGSVSQGEIDAADRTDALRLLDRKGLQPVSIKESSAVNAASTKKSKAVVPPPKPIARAATAEGEKAKPAEKSEGLLKMKRAEVVMFTEELSDMLGGGLQLEPAGCARWHEFF